MILLVCRGSGFEIGPQELQYLRNRINRRLRVAFDRAAQIHSPAMPDGNNFRPAHPMPGVSIVQMFNGIRKVTVFEPTDNRIRHCSRRPDAIVVPGNQQHRPVNVFDCDRSLEGLRRVGE